MNVFLKLIEIIKNIFVKSMSDATNSLVDIKREGEALIAAIDKDIKNHQKRIEDALAEVYKNKDEIDKRNIAIRTLNDAAKASLKKGDETTAIQFLSQVTVLESVIATQQMSVDTLTPLIEKQKSNLMQMLNERHILSAEIHKLSLEEQMYKTQANLTGGVGTGNAIDINYLRERVNSAKYKFQAKEAVVETTQHLELPNTTSTPVVVSVQDKLEKLKAELQD